MKKYISVENKIYEALPVIELSKINDEILATNRKSKNGNDKNQLFIPRGFAHGFVVFSERAVFSYKVDNYYSPESDAGLSFNDSTLGINWVLPLDQLKLSDKDSNLPTLEMLNNECLSFNYKKNLYDY